MKIIGNFLVPIAVIAWAILGLEPMLINIGAPWILSFLVPWVLVVILSLFMAANVNRMLKFKAKIVVAILVFLLSPGLMFAVNPIYQGDFTERGQDLDLKENRILADVLAYNPKFEGLVCIASPNCPYCAEAVQGDMMTLKKRGYIDVVVFMGAGGEEAKKAFQKATQSENLTYVLNSSPEQGLDMPEQGVPTYFYIKGGKVVHLWRNDQLGYPALDWIESKLKTDSNLHH